MIPSLFSRIIGGDEPAITCNSQAMKLYTKFSLSKSFNLNFNFNQNFNLPLKLVKMLHKNMSLEVFIKRTKYYAKQLQWGFGYVPFFLYRVSVLYECYRWICEGNSFIPQEENKKQKNKKQRAGKEKHKNQY